MDETLTTLHELNATNLRIARLEKTVAELLLKNEQLRQQASATATLPGEHRLTTLAGSQLNSLI